MKKAKVPQKRIIATLKMLFYINSQNVNQREALDRGEIKSGPKNNS